MYNSTNKDIYICNCLFRASTETIDSSKVTSHSDFIIPGWNDYVKTAHAEARQYYLLWRNSGKPHQGAAAELMSSRLNFKYILRQCQSNEEMIRADAMARSLTDKDSVSFWKHVRKSNSIHTPLSSNVNGVTGSSKITEMWSDH